MPRNEAEIRSEMKELNEKEQRNSHCSIRVPEALSKTGGYFAGKLIMDAGLRGYQVGGAQVSETLWFCDQQRGCNSSRYLSADEGRIG